MNWVSPCIAHASQSTVSRLTTSRLTSFWSVISRSTSSKYSSDCNWSWHLRDSLSSLDLGLQVHLHNWSIPASKYYFQVGRWIFSGTGVMEVNRVTGSINSAHPGVDRHHLISISSYHTMKIHTLSFPTFGHIRSGKILWILKSS
jgi:hypothetical protein